MTAQRREEIEARLKDLKRQIRKTERGIGRCDYFSPRGLAYAEWHRKATKEDKILRAELAAIDASTKEQIS